MASIAAFAAASGFEIPGLRETRVGKWVIEFVGAAERFIISHPQLHQFVDRYPGLAALSASAILWILLLLSCHLVFSVIVRILGNPWQLPPPSSYVMNPEFEAECNRRLNGCLDENEGKSTVTELTNGIRSKESGGALTGSMASIETLTRRT